MKKTLRRLCALALVCALVLSMGQTAFASEALGSELVYRTVELADGVSLTTGSLWSASKSDLRTEHFVTYTPGGDVSPMVFSGAYVASRNTVAQAAAEMEAQGYRVAAALNGGFFNSDGTIVGMLMTDGVLRSLDVANYTLIGFTGDGRVFVDESSLTKTVSWTKWDGQSVNRTLAGFNAYRNSSALGGLYLYNKDFSSRVSGDGARTVTVILRPVAGEDSSRYENGVFPWGEDDMADDGVLTMNDTLTLEVLSVTDTPAGESFDGNIPEGCYMLYAGDHNNEALLNELLELLPGDPVTVSVGGVSEQWDDAVYGISAITVLLRNGQIVSGVNSKDANPYTALGIKEDGTVIFYTIDGRRSGYSVGATYAQVAQRLQELGCVTAVALDGGGSTAMGATLPGSEKFTLVNRPSETRAVNNSILLVLPDAVPDGDLTGYYLTSDTQVVLTGASLEVAATPYDGMGYPMGSDAPAWSSVGGEVAAKGPAEGELANDGLTAVYTAGDVAGTYEVFAQTNRGRVSGYLPVRVVDKLSSLTVTLESNGDKVGTLLLSPGNTVDLTAKGIWWNLPVAMDDSNVVWTADEAIGTIDETGRFVAGGNNARGVITATAGGITVTIDVAVDRGDPFTDMDGHWASNYVTRLYKLGITSGIRREDGTYIFNPSGKLSRGELLVFIARLLKVDLSLYEDVELPFADADTIPDWVLPSVKAMYALQVFEGSANGGQLTANVGQLVDRQSAMVMLGRILSSTASVDLSDFADGASVSDWAAEQVKKLVALGVVEGSGGYLSPMVTIDRASAAKLLTEVYDLDKAPLTVRPGVLTGESDEPAASDDSEPEIPEEPEVTEDPEVSQDPEPSEDSGNPPWMS